MPKVTYRKVLLFHIANFIIYEAVILKIFHSLYFDKIQIEQYFL